MDLYSALSWTV